MGFGRKKVKAISSRGQRPGGKIVMVLFGGVFMAAGIGIMVGLLVLPVLWWQVGQAWIETPCRITHSAVETHQSSDGSTYSVDIHYTYAWEGRQYASQRYGFMSVSSSGYSGKNAVVNRYPVGAAAVCFVNPQDPGEAVLTRDFKLTYLIGLFGLPFFLVGFGVLVAGLRKKSTSDPSARLQRSPAVSGAGIGAEQVLKPRQGPVTKLVVIVVFALIWNSIVAFLVVHAFTGEGGGIVSLFALIFGAVGLALIAGIVYSVLALFNPRIQLKITPGAMPLGSTVDLEWTILGSTNRINRFGLWLEGREAATYRQGTDTRTDHNTFERIPIIEATNPNDMRTGRVQFAVPEFTMHSFEAPNNKIEWMLKVHGDIPRWPDMQEEYAVTVLPLAPSGRS